MQRNFRCEWNCSLFVRFTLLSDLIVVRPQNDVWIFFSTCIWKDRISQDYIQIENTKIFLSLLNKMNIFEFYSHCITLYSSVFVISSWQNVDNCFWYLNLIFIDNKMLSIWINYNTVESCIQIGPAPLVSQTTNWWSTKSC